MSLCLEQIASWLDIPCAQNRKITGISIDTRTLVPGDLFVALKGTRVDGHAFIPDAIKQGAAAVLCVLPQGNLDIPVLLYPDLEQALILMATAYRKTLTCRVIALTGSNGKTSVKTMLKAILGDAAFVTPGNWNNHLGVPLSVLQVQSSHQYAVFELGANHVGEIATTVAIVAPEVVCVNNIGPAHIGEFGSMDAIATAKGEIYAGLSSAGTAVVNLDDAYAHFWDDLIQDKHVLRFSNHDQAADIFARAIDLQHPAGLAFQMVSGDAVCDVVLQVRGAHHVSNALAAASMAKALGMGLDEIASGLGQFTGVSGRLTPKKTAVGALILDDTDNANLNSVLTGIEVLAGYSGKRGLALGDMQHILKRKRGCLMH